MIKTAVNNIYPAIEGEGVRIGTPQVFVRLQGCSVGCKNCDSKETWSFRGGDLMSASEILSKVRDLSKVKTVSVTGGDPLHETHRPLLLQLLKLLKSEGYETNIEVTGLSFVKEVFELTTFVSMDLKTPSTGVTASLDPIKEMIHYSLPSAFQLKSVIETKEDFDFVLEARKQLLEQGLTLKFPWVLTPCFNTMEEFPMKRFQDVMQWNLDSGSPFRVIGQQHKWIYGAKRRDV